MKKDRIVRLELDPKLDCIEIIVRAPQADDRVQALLHRLDASETTPLTVFDGCGNVRTLTEDEILSLSASGRLVGIVTTEGCWFTRRSLQSLETTLNAQRFVRISRHELVNLDHVQRYDFSVAGTLKLILSDGSETWASRRCIPAIRKRLTERT